jgi:hypothetical protein
LPNPSCGVGVEQLQIWYSSWGFWWWCMAFELVDFFATFALYVFEYNIEFWGQIQSLRLQACFFQKYCHYIIIIYPLIKSGLMSNC